MKSHTVYRTFNTEKRREFIRITEDVEQAVRDAGIAEGMALVCAMHITAAVWINDDEPGLQADTLEWLDKVAPPSWQEPANDVARELLPDPGDYRHHRGGDLDGRRLRKGAGDAVISFIEAEGGRPPAELQPVLDRIGREGGTPLAVARDSQVMGVIYLKDTIKEGMRERFDHLRAMGIRTVMITGDNRLTAAKIAGESGVDDFLAEATPEAKLALIKEQQSQGRMVAMTGDGTNDAPALAQADVGVAMNTGTQAAREAGNMVDLDSNPTKLIEIVEVGKQLLITRGALTTFSIANDVAKYFAILPAIFVSTWAVSKAGKSPLHVLNIMSLGTPKSAVISAIIFNALIIPLLIPLSLKGVRYRPIGASALLRRNLWIYGLGGIIAPFVGIKLIDLLVHNVLGA